MTTELFSRLQQLDGGQRRPSTVFVTRPGRRKTESIPLPLIRSARRRHQRTTHCARASSLRINTREREEWKTALSQTSLRSSKHPFVAFTRFAFLTFQWPTFTGGLSVRFPERTTIEGFQRCFPSPDIETFTVNTSPFVFQSDVCCLRMATLQDRESRVFCGPRSLTLISPGDQPLSLPLSFSLFLSFSLSLDLSFSRSLDLSFLSARTLVSSTHQPFHQDTSPS